MQVVWSLPAANDLNRIFSYIAQENPLAAQQVIQLIYEHCGTLSEFPQRARKSRLPGRFEMVFTDLPYIAIYRIRTAQVEIIRIYHTAQNWP